MNVRVEIQFKSPGPGELAAMRTLAEDLTNRAASVRVFAGENPDWLVAEFTMPTEAQYRAMETIDRSIRFWASNRTDSSIRFPKTAAEQARDARKATRRRAKRQERKAI